MKIKDKIKKYTKYFRELSVVVVGIAITFTVSDWIDSKKEKKSMKNYLNAVVIELQDNLEMVGDRETFYSKTKKLGHYLYVTEQKDLEVDSIEQYRDIIKSYHLGGGKTSAFEMLKASGITHQVDQVVLKSIWDSYVMLEEAVTTDQYYMNRKLEVIYDIFIHSKGDPGQILEPQNESLLNFFRAYADIDALFRKSAEQLEETLRFIYAALN